MNDVNIWMGFEFDWPIIVALLLKLLVQKFCRELCFQPFQVFVGWCSYVDARRRKAARYAEALDIYRRRLLNEGATKWLTVSSDLAGLRMKCAAEKGIQVSAIYFCAFHSNIFANIFTSFDSSDYRQTACCVLWLCGCGNFVARSFIDMR